MLSKSNIDKLRALLNTYNEQRIKDEGFSGNCEGFVFTMYNRVGLAYGGRSSSFCCANANKAVSAEAGNPNNGDIVFSADWYSSSQTCPVCMRNCGHTAIYMDGYAYGAQTTYKCPWDWWVNSFGYGGHTTMGNDYVEPKKTTTQCIQATYNGTKAQKWKLVKVGNYYKIVNADGKCLDVKGGSTDKSPLENRVIQAWKDNGTSAQLWKKVANPVGGYFFASKLNENYVLDICNSTIYKRAYFQLHHKQSKKEDMWAQAFEVRNIKESSTYKAIVNLHSFMCLDANPTGIKL